MDALYGAPQRSLADQVLHAYEHGEWVNRLALGDSLVVMNSLLRYEHLGGQVQMIYVDPPYGVKFGSNFQPFIRRRDMKHNEDDDLTREPNPDGTEIRDQPHLHVYREGYGLAWAEPVDWCDLTDPIGTLDRFLDVTHARFSSGLQLALI